MKMADEPHDRQGQRDQKNQKDQPSFAPFFAHSRGGGPFEKCHHLRRFQCNGNMKSLFDNIVGALRSGFRAEDFFRAGARDC